MIDPIRLLLALGVLLCTETGIATWYGPSFYGQPQANGDIYTADTWGVAHKTIPLGTTVVVMSRCGSVVVEVTDRGPYGPPDWIVDASPRVAAILFCGGYGHYNGVAYGMERVMVVGGVWKHSRNAMFRGIE